MEIFFLGRSMGERGKRKNGVRAKEPSHIPYIIIYKYEAS